MVIIRALRLCFQRRFLVSLMVVALVSPWLLRGVMFRPSPKAFHSTPPLDFAHKQAVHNHVQGVLGGQCRPGFARQGLGGRIPASIPILQPLLRRDTPLPPSTFLYPPPFGFLDLQDKLTSTLQLLPPAPAHSPPMRPLQNQDHQHQHQNHDCRRCVVIGNGGILRGLELGPLIDQFDEVIRLNSGPVKTFSRDVGNRTSFRMSYPEGSPKVWQDDDPNVKFVAVIYKAVDFNWLNAMISKQKVSLWDWLFFWQKVPDSLPLQPSQFYLLNPEIVRQTALDLLDYPGPKVRLWGWDQNIPTLGMTALNLASYLCDEVSLAGFGYNLSHKEAPLHYYDQLPMAAMLRQDMHNVNQERALLRSLVADGTISDLSGGIHCSFCQR